MELRLELGECLKTFNLERAICNHGYFMMAPNYWDPSTNTFTRPLRLAHSNSTSVMASISHPSSSTSLLIRLHNIHALPNLHQQAILKQVSRMLRISDKDEKSVREFQELHPHAKQINFGRIFRSPTLFEDVVKSMLLCNCKWGRTLDMCRALCELHQVGPPVHVGKKRRKITSNVVADFPSAIQLAEFDIESLNKKCNLGYRAGLIIDFANKVSKGSLKLNKFDEEDINIEKLSKRLMQIKGVGPFTCASIFICIGFYHRIPVDTETKCHLKNTYGITKFDQPSINKIYAKYAPFQSLAYWLELLEAYEKKFGKLSQLRQQDYSTVTSSFHS